MEHVGQATPNLATDLTFLGIKIFDVIFAHELLNDISQFVTHALFLAECFRGHLDCLRCMDKEWGCTRLTAACEDTIWDIHSVLIKHGPCNNACMPNVLGFGSLTA